MENNVKITISANNEEELVREMETIVSEYKKIIEEKKKKTLYEGYTPHTNIVDIQPIIDEGPRFQNIGYMFITEDGSKYPIRIGTSCVIHFDDGTSKEYVVKHSKSRKEYCFVPIDNDKDTKLFYNMKEFVNGTFYASIK